jgi:hypothetical protein
VIATKISPAFLESCGFREEAVQFPSYVLEHVGLDGPTRGFRLRLRLPASPGDNEWLAEITELHNPWWVGVGLGRYETQEQVLDLLIGLRLRENEAANLARSRRGPAAEEGDDS